MEKDEKTRVYITSASNTAWLAHPESTPYSARMHGERAKEVLDRADFRGVYGVITQTDSNTGEVLSRKKTWGVYPRPDGERIVVDITKSFGDEEYSKLAEVLEKKTGKKGLTIVVS